MIPASAYNPSLCRFRNSWWLTSRHHDRGDWRTSLSLANLDESLKPRQCFPIEPPAPFKDYSLEDARCIVKDDALWVSCTVSKWPAAEFRCVVIYGRLNLEPNKFTFAEWHQPKYGRNDFSALEKNWLPFIHNGHLWFYYATKDNRNTFIRVEKDRVIEAVEGKMFAWGWGPCHGGCIVQTDKGPLLFFNSRTGSLQISTHRYFVGCARLNPNPPFDAIEISKSPILRGEEGVNLNGHKWFKSNVSFACGAAVDGSDILLAYGWNDAKARIARLKEEHLKI